MLVKYIQIIFIFLNFLNHFYGLTSIFIDSFLLNFLGKEMIIFIICYIFIKILYIIIFLLCLKKHNWQISESYRSTYNSIFILDIIQSIIKLGFCACGLTIYIIFRKINFTFVFFAIQFILYVCQAIIDCIFNSKFRPSSNMRILKLI